MSFSSDEVNFLVYRYLQESGECIFIFVYEADICLVWGFMVVLGYLNDVNAIDVSKEMMLIWEFLSHFRLYTFGVHIRY